MLKDLGYEGAFREKHASPALKYEYPPDGMAVFYRSGRFTCSAGAVEGEMPGPWSQTRRREGIVSGVSARAMRRSQGLVRTYEGF